MNRFRRFELDTLTFLCYNRILQFRRFAIETAHPNTVVVMVSSVMPALAFGFKVVYFLHSITLALLMPDMPPALRADPAAAKIAILPHMSSSASRHQVQILFPW